MLIISPILRTTGKIASLVLYALTLAAAYGGHVNPDYMTIPAILTLALQYLAIATFVVAVIWLISKRFIIGGLGILTLVIGWGNISSAVPISFPKSAPEGATTFTLLTFNSLHLDDIQHPDADGNRASRFLMNCGADIICLQELEDWNDSEEIHNFPAAVRDSLFAVYPYRATGDFRNSDLKVLSKYPVKLVPGVAELTEYSRNRFSYFRVDIKGKRVGIINMHLTSYSLSDEERKVITDIHGARTAKKSIREFKSTIFSKLQHSFQGRADNVDDMVALTENMRGPIIICGDFNDVPASWAYRKMLKAGFKDAYTATNFGPTITFNQHLFLFHLDQIFYRGDIEPLWVKREKIKTSDHYPLMAEFALTP